MNAEFSFRRLEYFIAVSETGSIAGAAEKLNVSSPSISAAIVRLEEEFGVQLFVRKHARGMLLTGGGRRLLGEAKKIIKSADGLHNIAADLSGKVAGVLHLGCLQTVAPFVLPGLRKSFTAKYPDVRLHQTENHQAALLKGLQNADFDLCLTYDLNLSGNIHFESLADLPIYAIFAPSHPLSGRQTVSPADLSRERMIMLDLPISAKYFLSVFEREGIKPKITERFKDMALVRSMVANGFGYSLGNILPEPNTAPDGKQLKCVPIKTGQPPIRLGLASCYADYAPRAAAAFQSHCRSAITPEMFRARRPPGAEKTTP